MAGGHGHLKASFINPFTAIVCVCICGCVFYFFFLTIYLMVVFLEASGEQKRAKVVMTFLINDSKVKSSFLLIIYIFTRSLN